jgi:hypothetical protein
MPGGQFSRTYRSTIQPQQKKTDLLRISPTESLASRQFWQNQRQSKRVPCALYP